MRRLIVSIAVSCLILVSAAPGVLSQPTIPLPDGAFARLGLGTLHCMDIAPDGGTLALGTSLGIEIRDARTFELRAWVAGNSVWDVAFSPDGDALACPGDTGIRFVSTATREVVCEVALARSPWRLAFAPDGRLVACATTPDYESFQVEIVDVTNGRNVQILPAPSEVWSLAFSPDGKTLALGCRNGAILLFDIPTWRLTRTLDGHYGPVESLAFSPDSQRLASGEYQGWMATALLWDPAKGKKLRTLTEEHCYGVMFSPDGKSIAEGAQNGEVRIWDAEKGTRVATLAGLRLFDSWVRGDPMLRYTPDGRRILAGSGTEGEIIAWDVETGTRLAALTEHPAELWSLAFSPDAKSLAAGGCGAISIWDTETMAMRARLRATEGMAVDGLAFTLDGRTLIENVKAADPSPVADLASWHASNGVQLWDATTWVAHPLFAQDLDGTNALAVSPDGRFIATGTGVGGTKVWDAATLKLVRSLIGLQGYVNTVAFSPDGTALAAIDEAGKINLWSVPKWKLLRTLEGTPSNRPRDAGMDPPAHWTCLGYAPDGRTLASASSGADEIRFWDVATGDRVRTLAAPAAHAFAFSPDGRLLALASSRDVIVLDAATGQRLRTMRGDDAYVTCLAFSPDGRFLATAGYSGSVLLWECESFSAR